jgi:PTS system cellobiose-specific IIC component
MSKFEKSMEKMSPTIMKFANSKPIIAIKDGVMMTMPLTLVGSVFLLLAFIPLPSWNPWMTSLFGANWQQPLFQVTGASFDLMALVAVFGIAYNYAKNEGIDGINSGILGIVSFIIVTISSVTAKSGEKIGGVIPKTWTGGQGMIAAILIGLAVGYIYSWFITRDLRIKLPEGVPSGVVSAFTALIPAAVIMTLSMLVFIFFSVVTGKTFIEWIYSVLQIPLQGLTDSLGGALAIPFTISFLWWFGIHGAALIGGVMGPLLQANGLANQELVKHGTALVAGQNAHIVTQQFVDQFITFGGSGMTLGLVIAMLYYAKSSRLKTLGRLSIIPGLFNINEPILFGFTIVLNPMLFIPFVIVPMLSGLITYLSILSGFVPAFTAVQVPWTTPPIISGFIVGGWRAALLQALLILMAAVIYFPFLKKQDAQYVKEEQLSSTEYAESNGIIQ